MSSTILVILGSDDVAGGGGVEVDCCAAAVARHLGEPAKELETTRSVKHAHGVIRFEAWDVPGDGACSECCTQSK